MHRTIRALQSPACSWSAFPWPLFRPPSRRQRTNSISSPTVVAGLPFTETLDTSGATSESTDPAACSYPDGGADAATAWYSWTAAESGPIGAATWGSNYDTTVYVGTSDGNGGIDVLSCNDDTRSLQAAIRFDAVAGETYLIAVGASVFGDGIGGELVFALESDRCPRRRTSSSTPPATSSRAASSSMAPSVTAPMPASSHLLIVELVQRSSNRRQQQARHSSTSKDTLATTSPSRARCPDIGHFHPGPRMHRSSFACNDFDAPTT